MSQIKIIDPNVAKEKDAIKRDIEAGQEQVRKNPTELDKIEAPKGIFLDDTVTKKIKTEGQEEVRFYKFVHPDNGRVLFGNCLKGSDMPETARKNNGEWISPDHYYSNTDENYAVIKAKVGRKMRKMNSILDLEIVRSNPEFEKKIRSVR